MRWSNGRQHARSDGGPQGLLLRPRARCTCPVFQIRGRYHRLGDSFHGAFTYAMAKDMNQHEAIRFASAVAGLKATRLGGRSGLPTLEAVTQFMAERPDEARARRLADGTAA